MAVGLAALATAFDALDGGGVAYADNGGADGLGDDGNVGDIGGESCLLP